MQRRKKVESYGDEDVGAVGTARAGSGPPPPDSHTAAAPATAAATAVRRAATHPGTTVHSKVTGAAGAGPQHPATASRQASSTMPRPAVHGASIQGMGAQQPAGNSSSSSASQGSNITQPSSGGLQPRQLQPSSLTLVTGRQGSVSRPAAAGAALAPRTTARPADQALPAGGAEPRRQPLPLHPHLSHLAAGQAAPLAVSDAAASTTAVLVAATTVQAGRGGQASQEAGAPPSAPLSSSSSLASSPRARLAKAVATHLYSAAQRLPPPGTALPAGQAAGPAGQGAAAAGRGAAPPAGAPAGLRAADVLARRALHHGAGGPAQPAAVAVRGNGCGAHQGALSAPGHQLQGHTPAAATGSAGGEATGGGTVASKLVPGLLAQQSGASLDAPLTTRTSSRPNAPTTAAATAFQVGQELSHAHSGSAAAPANGRVHSSSQQRPHPGAPAPPDSTAAAAGHSHSHSATSQQSPGSSGGSQGQPSTMLFGSALLFEAEGSPAGLGDLGDLPSPFDADTAPGQAGEALVSPTASGEEPQSAQQSAQLAAAIAAAAAAAAAAASGDEAPGGGAAIAASATASGHTGQFPSPPQAQVQGPVAIPFLTPVDTFKETSEAPPMQEAAGVQPGAMDVSTRLEPAADEAGAGAEAMLAPSWPPRFVQQGISGEAGAASAPAATQQAGEGQQGEAASLQPVAEAGQDSLATGGDMLPEQSLQQEQPEHWQPEQGKQQQLEITEEEPAVATIFAVASGPLFGGDGESPTAGAGFFFGSDSPGGGSSQAGGLDFSAEEDWMQQAPLDAAWSASGSNGFGASQPSLPPPPVAGEPPQYLFQEPSRGRQQPEQSLAASAGQVQQGTGEASQPQGPDGQQPEQGLDWQQQQQQQQQPDWQQPQAQQPQQQQPDWQQQQQPPPQQAQQPQVRQHQASASFGSVLSGPAPWDQEESSRPPQYLEQEGYPWDQEESSRPPRYLEQEGYPWDQRALQQVPSMQESQRVSSLPSPALHVHPPPSAQQQDPVNVASAQPWQQANWGQPPADDGLSFFGAAQSQMFAGEEAGWGAAATDNLLPQPVPWQPAEQEQQQEQLSEAALWEAPTLKPERGSSLAAPAASQPQNGHAAAISQPGSATHAEPAVDQQQADALGAGEGLSAEPTLWNSSLGLGDGSSSDSTQQAEQPLHAVPAVAAIPTQQHSVQPTFMQENQPQHGQGGEADLEVLPEQYEDEWSQQVQQRQQAQHGRQQQLGFPAAEAAVEAQGPPEASAEAEAAAAPALAAGSQPGPGEVAELAAQHPTGAPQAPQLLPGIEGYTSPRAGATAGEELWDLESPKAGNHAEAWAAAAPADAAAAPAAEQDSQEGTTWLGEDGYCYFDSPDGWRYYWDDASQGWQQYQYIGGAEAGGGSGHVAATEAAVAPAASVEPAGNGRYVGAEEAQGVAEEEVQLLPSEQAAAEPAEVTPGADLGDSSQAACQGNAEPAAALPEQPAGFALEQPAELPTTYQPAVFQPAYSLPQPGEQHSQVEAAVPAAAAATPWNPVPWNPSASAPIFQPAGPQGAAATPSHPIAPGPGGSTYPYMPASAEQQARAGFYAASAVPATPAAIDYNDPTRTHWRPASCFGKLVFGGRLLLVMPSGQLSVHSMAALPDHLLRPLGGPHGTASLSQLRSTSASFPGPLSSSTPRDKVARFAGERLEACAGEEPFCRDAQGLQTLWALLRVLAQFQGNIKSLPYSQQPSCSKKDEGSSPEAALSAALLHPFGAAASPTAAAAGAPSPVTDAAALQPAGDAGQAAAQVQQLLLCGRRGEALRIATEAQLWGIALLVARLLGEQAVAATGAAMAGQCLAAGAPLRTLCSMLAGGPEALLAAAPAPAAAAPAAVAAAAGAAPGLLQGHLLPHPGRVVPFGSPAGHGGGGGGAAGTAVAMAGAGAVPAGHMEVLAGDWRQQLAVLAANRTPGDERVMERLGETLLRQGHQMEAAHCCFLLAGLPLQLADAPAPTFVLPGSDLASAPRTFASLAAVTRAEVYAWARTAATPSLAPQFAALLPYKLLHAAALLELGLLPQAAQYCHHILAGLQALGKVLPPGLLVTRVAAQDLQDRLQAFASANKLSLGRSFSAGSLVSSMGRWLDRGITALMGGGGAGGGSGDTGSGPNSLRSGPSSASGINLVGLVDGGQRLAGHSRSHSFSNAANSPKMVDVPGSTHFRTGPGPPTSGPPSTSSFGVPPQPPSTGLPPLPRSVGGASSTPAAGAAAGPNQAVASQAPPPAVPAEGPRSTGRSGGAGGVMKGLISLISGPASRGKEDPKAKQQGPGASQEPQEPENVFYYDTALKMWRERGAPPPAQQAPPPPPPTVPTLPYQGGAGGPPPVGGSTMTLPRGGVTSRYVNTFGPAGQPAQVGIGAGIAGIAPAPSLLLPRGSQALTHTDDLHHPLSPIEESAPGSPGPLSPSQQPPSSAPTMPSIQSMPSGAYGASVAATLQTMPSAASGVMAAPSMQSMPSVSQPPATLQPLRIPSGPSSSLCSPTACGLVPGMKFASPQYSTPQQMAMPLPSGHSMHSTTVANSLTAVPAPANLPLGGDGFPTVQQPAAARALALPAFVGGGGAPQPEPQASLASAAMLPALTTDGGPSSAFAAAAALPAAPPFQAVGGYAGQAAGQATLAGNTWQAAGQAPVANVAGPPGQGAPASAGYVGGIAGGGHPPGQSPQEGYYQQHQYPQPPPPNWDVHATAPTQGTGMPAPGSATSWQAYQPHQQQQQYHPGYPSQPSQQQYLPAGQPGATRSAAGSAASGLPTGPVDDMTEVEL